MRIAAGLTAAAALWCAAAPARANFQGTNLGSHNQAASLTNPITTVSSCKAGSTVAVFASYVVLADSLSSVADSAGNTYQAPTDNISGTGVGIGVVYAYNIPFALPSGGTITGTFAGVTNTSIGAICFNGADAGDTLDVHGQTAQGLASMAATTTNTGALAIARELVAGVVGAPTTTGSLACGGSYVHTINILATPALHVCQQVVTSLSSVAFSPTWANSVNYVVDLTSFKGFPPSLGGLGVGY